MIIYDDDKEYWRRRLITQATTPGHTPFSYEKPSKTKKKTKHSIDTLHCNTRQTDIHTQNTSKHYERERENETEREGEREKDTHILETLDSHFT